MAIATVAGGLFNMLSSLIAFRMPGGQVNVFDTAQAALALFGIPALGVQAAFASLAANADAPGREPVLAATMRATFLWLGLVWAVLAAGCFLAQDRLLALYGLSHPALLWVVVGIALVTLWTPVTNGILQGRQDFLWFGLGTLLNGLGRFAVLAAVVLGLGLGALGGLIGVLAGSCAVFALVTWRARHLLLGPRPNARPDWNGFLRRALPLTLGLGALVTIMQADALVVRETLQPHLSEQDIVVYTAARRIAQVLVYLVGAVVGVMYPKVARSFQRTEPSEALRLTLLLTAGASILGAVATSLIPQLPLRVLAGPDAAANPAARQLVIAYTWALVPLALSNVLAWNLLARECYRVVPALIAITAGYWLALRWFHDRLLTVIAVVGLSALTLLAACALFTFLHRPRPSSPNAVS